MRRRALHEALEVHAGSQFLLAEVDKQMALHEHRQWH